MLDSWVSPEAAGFFISFTEGQNPLLPASPPSTLSSQLLSHSPSLSSAVSRSLLVGEPKGQPWPLLERTLGPFCAAVEVLGISRAQEGHLGGGLDLYFSIPCSFSPHFRDCCETCSLPPHFYRKKDRKRIHLAYE